MNDFDLRKYLKNNLLLESKEYEKEMPVVNEAARVPSNVLDFAKRKGPYATALVKKAATWAEKAGKYISGGTAIGKNYDTIILDMKHQGSEIYISLTDETIELFGEEVTDAKSFQKVYLDNQEEPKDSLDEKESIEQAKEAVEPVEEIEIAAEGANIRAHDEMNAAAKRTEKLIKIANELFPDIAKKQDGGKLIDFSPLDISQRNQVYQKYTEGSTKIKENDYAHNPNTDPRTEQIIQMLKDMDIDGETMEYILVKVGMDDQIANQLVNNPAEYEDEVSRAVGESRELRGMAEEELHADSSTVHINGRAVDINSLDVDGVDPQDRPDFVDAYFVSGNYQDGDELSDEELDHLTLEYPEIVGDLANQY